MQKGSKANPKGQDAKASQDFRTSTPVLSSMRNNRGQLHSQNQSRLADSNGNAAGRRPKSDQNVTLSPIAGQQSSYSFPKPSCMSLPVLDKYKSLVQSLEVLKLHDEKEILEEPSPNPKKGLKGKTNAKKPMHRTFSFTENMFKTGNSSSEAFIEVTHFLFEKIDKEATSVRFRNAWPIFEKKQEALYRNAAVHWFKELIEKHPNFFSRSVKVEQLPGLISNPCGDRFIRFIHSFADFVTYIVTSRDQSLDAVVPLLDKFVPTGNPEVTRRQAKIVGNRIAVLDNIVFKEQKNIVKLKMQTRDQKRKCNDDTNELKKELFQRKAELSNSIKTHPEIFPPDAANLLAEEEQYIKKELRERAAVDRNKAVITPLYKHVLEERIRRCDELGRKVEILIAFFEKHSRLWTMLMLARDKRLSLDFRRLCLPSISRVEIPAFDQVIEYYAMIAKTASNKINSLEISPDLRRRLDRIRLQLSIIRQNQDGVAAITRVRTPDYQTCIDHEIKRLGNMLEGVDWSKFTTIQVPPLSSLLNFSPPRLVDGSRATGLSSGISTYLPTIEVSKVNEAKSVDKTGINFSRCDMCDSPVSHRPFKATMEPEVLIQSGSSSRCISRIGKFHPSLPPPRTEIGENPRTNNPTFENLKLSPDGNNNYGPSATNVEQPSTPSGMDISSKERMELWEQFAGAKKETPPDLVQFPPHQKRISKRRSSLQGVKNARDASDNPNQSFSSTQDLEVTLGIMDVTLSLADLLDVTYDEEDPSSD